VSKWSRLEKKATQIRILLTEALLEAGSGHWGGSLDLADVWSALLFYPVVKYNSKKPNWPERDRVILSCGHTCPAFYSALALAGYFPIKELKTLRKLNSRLQGHPHIGEPPGIESTTGPLGQGYSFAVGIATAGKMDGKKWRVWMISSDGEHQEGQVWEAAMKASHLKLDNLTVILDRNYLQIDGNTEDINALDPLADKYKSFGWNVIEIDGHNIEEIVDACNQARESHNKPTVIIAHTTMGKGVPFIENNAKYHGIAPTADEAGKALKLLKKKLNNLS